LETLEELRGFLAAASPQGVRGRLLPIGEARATIRRGGELPDDAPAFPAGLDSDLKDYGFSVLRASLAFREANGDLEVWRLGFYRAGEAFDALIRNASPDSPERGFLRVMGAAGFHLAGYSAMAYSILASISENQNFAPAEQALASLILRDLSRLRREARDWLLDIDHSDESIAEDLRDGTTDRHEAISVILSSTIFRALAYFDFALATSDAQLYETASVLLHQTLALARDGNAVPLWWITRVAVSLIDDLWTNSLHNTIPREGPQGSENYPAYRETFLASLYAREVAELELWPSQMEAAGRAVDISDDLVVSLPTSAGKTRIAEIAALMALACGQRVLIVTPLRALSAQTERSFRRTFSPLGLSVSSLYGASGMIPGDEDALRSRNIVIATPEKLDFALRNDASLIDDVGLIVLDEGHLIGPQERELRFEMLVQRLLRRPDAAGRRIVCLSAILPEGQELNDLNSWIRSDAEGDPVQSQWRPTRQRFGVLRWQGRSARLEFDLDDNGPFIPRFVEQRPAIRPRRKPFPTDTRELTLAAAWKFAEEGKRVLIFCTQRDHVDGYATTVNELIERGFLPELLDENADIQRALTIGGEWLGLEHPAVVCLRHGVAIHHGRLPSAFLREVERLLAAGVLKVTVASPTLAQGLNLNAAVLLIPNLYRSGQPLSGEEFANVAGRAGRAFVDIEGLVVHVMFDDKAWRIRTWRELVRSAKARSLQSGLIQIVAEIISRLARGGALQRADAFEYLANNRPAWEVAHREGEEPSSVLIERLDTAILALVEALEADADDLPRLLDEALNGSLWARQIARLPQEIREWHRRILQARSRLIWTSTTAAQRRGHFAMGVGLDAGLALDQVADNLMPILDRADLAAIEGTAEALAEALTELADRLLRLRPFIPDARLPSHWRRLLQNWISGVDVNEIGPDNMRTIEDAFTYRLVWALEALRMRRAVAGGSADFIVGGAAASLETGLPNLRMSLLVRAGLPSRHAAISAIEDLDPLFTDNSGMVGWLRSNEVAALSNEGTWPTEDTAALWRQFRSDVLAGQTQKWTINEWARNVDQDSFRMEPELNRTYRVEITRNDTVWVCTPDFRRVVRLRRSIRNPSPSVLAARFNPEMRQVIVRRVGRGTARWSEV
jgi:superfamily II DNA/RNA helicase